MPALLMPSGARGSVLLQMGGDGLEGDSDLLLRAGEEFHVPDCVGDIAADALTEGGRLHDVDGKPFLPLMDFPRVGVQASKPRKQVSNDQLVHEEVVVQHARYQVVVVIGERG